MPDFLSPFMYGDPNFRVSVPLQTPDVNNNLNNNNNNMLGALVGAGASLLGGLFSGMSAKKRQQQAIENQWRMFNAQIAHQDKVNQQAMSFQREMNQENREWNTESNVRQRIEDAGYNPYLYQNGAMSANTSSSTPLAQNVAPTSPTELSEPYGEFANSALNVARGVADILKTKQDVQKTAVDTATQDYLLNRQKTKDGYKIGGTTLPKLETQQVYYDVEKAFNLAIQEQVNATLSTMRQSLYQSPAVDENDQPVTDETGRQLTMYEASGRAEFKSNMKQLDKLLTDISYVKTESDLNKIKKKLDEYDLKFLKPAQLAQIHAVINEIGAKIKEIRTYTGFIGQQTKTERERTSLTRQQTKTEKNKTTRELIDAGLSAKDYKSYDTDKYIDRTGKIVGSVTDVVNSGANVANAVSNFMPQKIVSTGGSVTRSYTNRKGERITIRDDNHGMSRSRSRRR